LLKNIRYDSFNQQPALMAVEIYHSDLFDGFTPSVVKDGIADARIHQIKNKGNKANLL
jgi:hypothetical protein